MISVVVVYARYRININSLSMRFFRDVDSLCHLPGMRTGGRWMWACCLQRALAAWSLTGQWLCCSTIATRMSRWRPHSWLSRRRRKGTWSGSCSHRPPTVGGSTGTLAGPSSPWTLISLSRCVHVQTWVDHSHVTHYTWHACVHCAYRISWCF
jgi:hypothetical protein